MKPKGKKRLLFILIPLLGAFAFAEAAFRAARLFTIEKPVSPIRYQQVPDDLFTADEAAGTLLPNVYTSDPIPIAVRKSRKAFRVYSFGGSATMGAGFPRNGSFTHWLDRMLTLSYQDRKIEAINLGVVGYGSAQVRYLAEKVLAAGDPDLIVIYMGNNEFLDFKAASALSASRISPAVRIRRFLESRSLLLGHLGDALSAKKTKEEGNETILSDYRKLWFLPNQESEVYARYEKNLRAIVRAAKRKNVPIVICTLIANPLPNFNSYFIKQMDMKNVADAVRVEQAIGWHRLGFKDKAQDAALKVSWMGDKLRLLQIAEAGGPRALDRLSAEVRANLEETARARLWADLRIPPDQREEHQIYEMALSYRILGAEKELNALLEGYRSTPEAPSRASPLSAAMFAQFGDREEYRKAFQRCWEESNQGLIATPRTNEIVRRVAAEEGAALADIEQGLGDWIEPTPRRYLLDYCHFNIEGAFEAARILFETCAADHILPPNPVGIDFRSALFEPDLKYLRTHPYDFTDEKRWMGMDFQTCCVYAECRGDPGKFKEWFEEDATGRMEEEPAATFRRFHVLYQ